MADTGSYFTIDRHPPLGGCDTPFPHLFREPSVES